MGTSKHSENFKERTLGKRSRHNNEVITMIHTNIQDWISVIPYQCNALPNWERLHVIHLCSIVLEHGEGVVNGQEPFGLHWGLHLYVTKIKILSVSYFHGHKQSRNDSIYLTCWILELLALTLIFILSTCAICVGQLTMKERLHCSNNLFETEENVQTWAFRMTCSFSLMSLLCNIWVVHCIISKRKFFPENPISRIRTVTHKKCEKIPVISLSSSSCLSFVNTTSCPSLLKAWREREMEKRNWFIHLNRTCNVK